MCRTLILFLLSLLSLAQCPALGSESVQLTSPDGSHSVSFHQISRPDGTLEMRYSVQYRGQVIIDDSRCGLNLDNRTWEMALGLRELQQYASWMDPMELDSVNYHAQVDTTWSPLYGERSLVHENYNSCTLYLSRKPEAPIDDLTCVLSPSGVEKRAHRKTDEKIESNYRINIEVRAYNEGIAFRYHFPEHPAAIFHKIVADETQYTLPQGTRAWSQQWAQAFHEHLPIDKLIHPVEMPLTMDLPSGLWVSILTADVDDWCLTRLQTLDGTNTLQSVMYSPVDLVTYYSTPWRIIMAADSPGQLIEHNDIVAMLNPPCAIDDASDWIHPGTIMRETTLTMEGARATIDFCARHNIRYMLFDWKWYEPCTSHDGDATQPIDRLDIPEVCRYAQSKGVGVWLYVNQHALMKQARELFPLLRQWGVTGVKSGFVQYASHRWAAWLHDLVRLAAENHLLMNIHDEYRPSGFSRTFPNLLTQEGICGNEEFPDADHDVTLPFTRMLCGAADYTVCYYDKRLQNTHGHQLAASMIYYSPLVTLFWYDRPELSHEEPELSWFDRLPTSWDDTRVLCGQPQEYIVMARRKGNVWYVAAMGGNDARTLTINLAQFLPLGKAYHLTLYQDDPAVKTATHVSITDRQIKRLTSRNASLQLPLQPRGGSTIIIELND